MPPDLRLKSDCKRESLRSNLLRISRFLCFAYKGWRGGLAHSLPLSLSVCPLSLKSTKLSEALTLAECCAILSVQILQWSNGHVDIPNTWQHRTVVVLLFCLFHSSTGQRTFMQAMSAAHSCDRPLHETTTTCKLHVDPAKTFRSGAQFAERAAKRTWAVLVLS